ncbi:MAG: hypothetical protein GX604_00085 [Actinobacteria bacterium]|nr:hypothetical protein [Actinomycetota bacterium]
MKDCYAKNAKWYGDMTFVSEAGTTLTYAEYDARLGAVAQELKKIGVRPTRILAVGLSDIQCLCLYGLVGRNGYMASVVSPYLDDAGHRAVFSAFPADLVMAPKEKTEELAEVLGGISGDYQLVDSCTSLMLLGEVALFRAAGYCACHHPLQDMSFAFLDMVGDNVRVTAMSRRTHLDAVRALCAELPLNCHDTCVMDLPSQTLFGNLAWSCVLYRGAHGIRRRDLDFTASAGSGVTAVFTSSFRERPHGLQKVFRFLVEPVDGELACETGESLDRTLIALGSAVPSFRLHAVAASGSDEPTSTWTVAPLLGVDPVISVHPTESLPWTDGAGCLLVHTPFDACVSTLPDDDTGPANTRTCAGFHGVSFGKHVATGYLARLDLSGRLLVWPASKVRGSEERRAER